MNYAARRNSLFEKMDPQSVLILYSGVEVEISVDDYFNFEANRHFFYLTGLRRDHMILVMKKMAGKEQVTLYIPETDPKAERWTGKMVTVEEAKAVTGIEDVRTTDRAERELNALFSTCSLSCAYFDTYRHASDDLPHYNLVQARRFAETWPGVPVRNLWPMVTALRMNKDEDEVALMRRAIDITDQSLQRVLSRLKPGNREYQAQADFEYQLHWLGAEGTAFPTIAGSGMNGTMMHYETNRETMEDGSLVLLDLGTRLEGYNCDITRTYPVNGKYTERQKAVYDIVLKANREIARVAKPDMTLKELNEICKHVLAEGCIRLGLIREESEIGKYYMHGVSHHLGIDVHDVTLPESRLTPGCVITDEPGLYIDEWQTGIRIEDDLLITEDGCVCLSEQIIRTTDEIEAFMAAHREA